MQGNSIADALNCMCIKLHVHWITGALNFRHKIAGAHHGPSEGQQVRGEYLPELHLMGEARFSHLLFSRRRLSLHSSYPILSSPLPNIPPSSLGARGNDICRIKRYALAPSFPTASRIFTHPHEASHTVTQHHVLSRTLTQHHIPSRSITYSHAYLITLHYTP